MSVFRQTTIEWDDQKYSFVPSMALLRSIEQEVSIMHVAHSVSQGKPRISHMAFIIATVMKAAGAKISEEEITAELAHGNPEAVMQLYMDVIDAITPQRPDSKKADAAPE